MISRFESPSDVRRPARAPVRTGAREVSIRALPRRSSCLRFPTFPSGLFCSTQTTHGPHAPGSWLAAHSPSSTREEVVWRGSRVVPSASAGLGREALH
jgi:hypothetical protein